MSGVFQPNPELDGRPLVYDLPLPKVTRLLIYALVAIHESGKHDLHTCRVAPDLDALGEMGKAEVDKLCEAVSSGESPSYSIAELIPHWLGRLNIIDALPDGAVGTADKDDPENGDRWRALLMAVEVYCGMVIHGLDEFKTAFACGTGPMTREEARAALGNLSEIRSGAISLSKGVIEFREINLSNSPK